MSSLQMQKIIQLWGITLNKSAIFVHLVSVTGQSNSLSRWIIFKMVINYQPVEREENKLKAKKHNGSHHQQRRVVCQRIIECKIAF